MDFGTQMLLVKSISRAKGAAACGGEYYFAGGIELPMAR
jgi:hypothetical protein